MKICCVIEKYPDHPSCAGGEFSAQRLFAALSKSGHEVHVVTVKYSDAYGKEKADGVNIHRILSDDYGFGAKGSGLKYLYMQNEGFYSHAEMVIRGFISDNEIDVVHCHSPNMIIPVARAVKGWNVISSVVVNEQFATCAAGNKHVCKGRLCNSCSAIKVLGCNKIGKSFLNKFVLSVYFYNRMMRYRKHILNYDAVFCVSNDVKKRLGRIGIKNTTVTFNIADSPGNIKEPSIILGSGIDRIREKFQRVILFIAVNLDDDAKGSHLVYNAAKRLPEYVFICVGECKKKIDRPNLVFTGKVLPEYLAYYYSLSDIVVIPSICPDALPRVGLEALAMSKPVVGSDCGGIPDIIEDGANGLLFESGDTNSLVRKIKEIFIDNAKLITMGENSLERAKTLFSDSNVVDRVNEVYENIQ